MTTKHPAHGPVSLDRLHQISEILSKAAAQSDGGNLGYAMADAVKVIDGVIAKFEEQDNPRPVMAVKGELGFIDNLEKIIEERDEDIDIGQLGSSNYDALMLAALDAFRTSIPEPVVPEPKSYMDFWEQYPDMTAQEAIDRSAGWNASRAAMLQAGNSPVTPDTWIPVSESMPEPGRWLALYGQRVFTHGSDKGKPFEEPCVDQGYLGSDGKFYLLNWDYPGDINDNYNNHLAIATHWMYWESPSAPQQEVK
ncbi:DUF551 domain-containing protein [Citrobacter cronae]|uniref:DUF551 domain-containing protein n=1 Tax=Citrobacter cronae TaxID=1748967 RepID=UPI001902AB5B|nr:DUF551 domain-containing protein [Citrobacter cronae]MBJ8369074.1 DUF551 domain-containing protein [Citrobacter cronae]MBJ8396854.1 DUF551 domain-containing protein [Citrobacter cronae]MBJ8410981.1 DUF551 domain-containing protein [Citrobacter cronae]